MSGALDFTERQARLLHRLVYGKGFQSGTREHIARWLIQKNRADTPTRAFVTRLIDLSYLEPIGTRPVKIGDRLVQRPVYDRDSKRIKELWLRTAYGEFTHAVLDDIAVVID